MLSLCYFSLPRSCRHCDVDSGKQLLEPAGCDHKREPMGEFRRRAAQEGRVRLADGNPLDTGAPPT